MTDVCALLQEHMARLFRCEQAGASVRISTPFFFPDGGLIDLFVDASEYPLTVTDSGETVGWLNGQTAAEKLPDWFDAEAKAISRAMGVEWFGGELQARVGADLAAAVLRVGTACVRVADLRTRFVHRALSPAADDVAGILDRASVAYTRNVKEFGRSGHEYTVPFRTRTPRQSAIVGLVTRGEGRKSRQPLERTCSMWFDLADLPKQAQPVALVSVFDDVRSKWSEAEYALLERTSRVARLSQPAEILAAVQGQAA